MTEEIDVKKFDELLESKKEVPSLRQSSAFRTNCTSPSKIPSNGEGEAASGL